jgi:hypothetical protein
VIPGLVDITRMTKITYPKGGARSVIQRLAVYSDPESRIQVCETYYQREKASVREVIFV